MAGPVTVLGLGDMGSAIAKTFLDRGYRTTVWNRTASVLVPHTSSQPFSTGHVRVVCASAERARRRDMPARLGVALVRLTPQALRAAGDRAVPRPLPAVLPR